ncbi:UDP-N-acetyl-D-glucosamine dehydrogenase [Rhodoblastus sphagnicola]|uniref:UDP-N-acetyl-D-glucosamine dehydrogenase n=2 Tax=Rhodoblastus sphagnicola TaxID=333368 RepID=A0A2S6NAM7_9HYPH|nr:nucleotide sugar dehydrogenase [Rhodoblastus sphagnicola]MBB4200295.1 UDP-N-acetyl-D-glucosamine dehydrogenase [Rhodoblastus sphagnicola]PPQ31678.1 UDP-N-acetyl-D-glucosamine dehydrogenase [Rhodoblastus sphagnicola]
MDTLVQTRAADLPALFREKRGRLGVIGLGYVGLPICLAAARAGLDVIGFDIDKAKPEALRRNESYLKHIDAAAVTAAVESGRFQATSDLALLSEADALLICVPTPLTAHLDPDLSYVVKTAEMIAEILRPGQIVILESTTYPGTTEDVVRPILEQGGLKVGEDILLAFSPEREDPGNERFSSATIPKVVGADDELSLAAVTAVYDAFVERTVQVSSSRVAEAVKLTENIFRAVNIALVNELKLVYEPMGVDVWEVIDAAKTKPFGFMPFYPGPGLGGHCIPIDPFYLTWKAREYGMATRFIELAGQINSAMPQHVVNRLAQALDMHSERGLNGARVLVLGVAYKKNVDDMRESPALKLIELVEARGAKTEFYDPFVSLIPPTREHAALSGRRSLPWSAALAGGYDATLIVTDHDTVDYRAIVDCAPLVVDTRNACRRFGVQSSKIVLA